MIAGNFDRVTYSHPTDIAHEICIPPPQSTWDADIGWLRHIPTFLSSGFIRSDFLAKLTTVHLQYFHTSD